MTTLQQATLKPGPPESGDAGAAAVEPLPAATLGIRVLARLIDIAVLWGLQFATIQVFWLLASFLVGRTMTYETALQRVSGRSALTYVASIVALSVYYAMCEGLYGATPGKLICGLAVVREDGSHCGLGEAFGRALVYPIDILFGIGRMQRGPLHQRLGDRWVHTVVVRRRELRPAWDRTGGLFVGALLLACPLYGLIILSHLLLRLLG